MAASLSAFVQPVQIRTRQVVPVGHSPAVCRASAANAAPGEIPSIPSQPNNDNEKAGRFSFLPRCIRPARLPAAVLATAGALLGAAITSSTAFFPMAPRTVHAATTTNAKEAPPTKKQLRYDGRQELDSHEKAMSLTLTAGTFAALGVWAWKQNRRDDELETVRIKDEVDRLEKIRAEFVDVEEDDESLDDEDLLASLKQRISDGEEDDTGDSPQDGVLAEGAESETVNQETTSDNDEASTDDGNPDSVDMLRRMWDATDEEPTKDKA